MVLHRYRPDEYQIAPGGARSKRIGGVARHVTAAIPDCSGGSEIKTRCQVNPNAGEYQIAPGGARSKHGLVKQLATRLEYQIAPGGARSKPDDDA